MSTAFAHFSMQSRLRRGTTATALFRLLTLKQASMKARRLGHHMSLKSLHAWELQPGKVTQRGAVSHLASSALSLGRQVFLLCMALEADLEVAANGRLEIWKTLGYLMNAIIVFVCVWPTTFLVSYRTCTCTLDHIGSKMS